MFRIAGLGRKLRGVGAATIDTHLTARMKWAAGWWINRTGHFALQCNTFVAAVWVRLWNG